MEYTGDLVRLGYPVVERVFVKDEYGTVEADFDLVYDNPDLYTYLGYYYCEGELLSLFEYN